MQKLKNKKVLASLVLLGASFDELNSSEGYLIFDAPNGKVWRATDTHSMMRDSLQDAKEGIALGIKACDWKRCDWCNDELEGGNL